MIIAHEYIKDIVKDITICGRSINFVPANKSLITEWISSNAKDNNIESYPLIVMQTPSTKNDPNLSLSKVDLENQRFIFAVDTEHNYTTDERYDINFKPILFPLLEAFIKAMKKDDRVTSFNIRSYEDVEFFGNTKEVANDKWDYIELFADIQLIDNCKC